MNANRAGILLLALLILAATVHAACYYPRLPDKMATHFGSGGQANGWSTKRAAMGIYLGTMLGCGAMFLAMGVWLAKLPAWTFNLPNKEYWLSPERKLETCRVLSAFLIWFGNATLLLLMAMMHLVFWANLGKDRNPDIGFYTVMAVYFVFIAPWLALLLWRFRRRS